MFKKVIFRKNITISKTNTLGVFNENINLNFTPDEMIVKQITTGNQGAPVNLSFRVFCSTINETIGSLNDFYSVIPNLTFEAKNYPFNNRWDFRLLKGDGSVETAFTADIFIHLEFIKYE